MLKLQNIKKEYCIDKSNFLALKGISAEFKENEFISIVGPSGCGKTTLLNIIGGLDKATDGELIINEQNTKDYKDWQWDFYRNKYIGFVFQSYNLINHITVLKNVEMALTLSGVNSKQRKIKAIDALKQVGLEKQIDKLPNQLSGGQKQRVAIARAIVNNPKIILADEPTGALDSKSSIQIMDLLKEVSKDKLVIMVSHNRELADKYSTRIIEMLDGQIINDKENQVKINKKQEKNDKNDENIIENSNIIKTQADLKKENDIKKENIKSTKMSYLTALKLSFSNLKTKKGRTLITSLASSIGIIGVALVLFLSNGFSAILNKYERDVFSQMPLTITKNIMLPPEKINPEDFINNTFTEEKLIYPLVNKSNISYTNNISKEYVDYIDKIDSKNYQMLNYVYGNQMFLSSKNNNHKLEKDINDILYSMPKDMKYINKNYDVLHGRLPLNNNEGILVINTENQINKKVLNLLNFTNYDKGISFEEFLKSEFSIVNFNDAYIKENETKFILKSNITNEEYSKNIIKICGIVRLKKDNNVYPLNNGIYVFDEVKKLYRDVNMQSEITLAQINNKNYDILRETNFIKPNGEDNKYKSNLILLAANNLPTSITIYPQNKKCKDDILTYLDNWNKLALNDEEKVYYTDFATILVDMLTQMKNMSSTVLIVFASISLVVSTVMISIITYISVIERTKEIGILKSLGARKKDITRVFKAESSIIGFLAGIIGVIISVILCFPINAILVSYLSTLAGAMKPSILYSLLLIAISVILTYISALIPARIASKKDAVEALRVE